MAIPKGEGIGSSKAVAAGAAAAAEGEAVSSSGAVSANGGPLWCCCSVTCPKGVHDFASAL